MPVDQLVELVQALLLWQMELALAGRQMELKLVLLCHIQLNHTLLRSSHRSIRQQSDIHKLGEPVMLHGVPHGRSQPVHMSKQKPRMGCSSIGYGESGHRFRQQLRGELVRLCHSDRRRKRS